MGALKEGKEERVVEREMRGALKVFVDSHLYLNISVWSNKSGERSH